jgi:hypothetical protein
MELHTELVFKRNGVCDSLEEIRKTSHNSGVVKMDEIGLYIWPTEDLEAEVKPYEDIKDLKPINDWKGPIQQISLHLPLIDKVNKKLDKLYGPDELYPLADEAASYFGMWWSPTSEKLESWDYYGFSFSGRSLCDKKGDQLNKALNTSTTYESDMCNNCSNELKDFCKEITSILNKYSLPKKIKITRHQEK